jgi:hypothetical protein
LIVNLFVTWKKPNQPVAEIIPENHEKGNIGGNVQLTMENGQCGNKIYAVSGQCTTANVKITSVLQKVRCYGKKYNCECKKYAVTEKSTPQNAKNTPQNAKSTMLRRKVQLGIQNARRECKSKDQKPKTKNRFTIYFAKPCVICLSNVNITLKFNFIQFISPINKFFYVLMFLLN